MPKRAPYPVVTTREVLHKAPFPEAWRDQTVRPDGHGYIGETQPELNSVLLQTKEDRVTLHSCVYVRFLTKHDMNRPANERKWFDTVRLSDLLSISFKGAYPRVYIRHGHKFHVIDTTGDLVLASQAISTIASRVALATIPFTAAPVPIAEEPEEEPMRTLSGRKRILITFDESRSTLSPMPTEILQQRTTVEKSLHLDYSNKFKSSLIDFLAARGTHPPPDLDILRLLAWTCFPVLRPYVEAGTLPVFPPVLLRHFRRATSLDDLATRLFGISTKAVRRLLVEKLEDAAGYDRILGVIDGPAVTHKDMSMRLPLWFANAARGLVTLDDIQTILRAPLGRLRALGHNQLGLATTKLFPSTDQAKVLRQLFKRYSRQRIVRLALSSEDIGQLPDILRMFEQAPADVVLPESPRNWQDFHDLLARDIAKWGMSDFPLKPPKAVEALDGAEAMNGVKLQLKVARSSHQLVDWGVELRNCVGGYARAAASGQIALVGVYKDHKLTYCMELTDFTSKNTRVAQFSGFANSPPDPHDREVVAKLLETAYGVS